VKIEQILMKTTLSVRGSTAVLTVMAINLTGCGDAGKGAVSAAARRALAGLAIGSLTGVR
jgi:hypothetical protein